MIIVDTDVISATSAADDKKAIGMDMSDSLFDYETLLEENNDSPKQELFQGLFNDDQDSKNIGSISNKRPNIMQWGPHDGQESLSIVSVVLQHHEEAAPMKIVFGTIAVETAQQQHRLANSTSDNSSVWITLAAPVPPLQDTRSETNEVQVSICLFDCADPDLAVDTWNIGKFTYIDIPEEVKTIGRKRALSCEPDESPFKKSTFDVKLENELLDDVNSQLLKLLAPYDPLLTIGSGNASHTSVDSTNPPINSHSWLSPASSNSSNSGNYQPNYSTTTAPSYPIAVNHMMLQQGRLSNNRQHAYQMLPNQEMNGNAYLPTMPPKQDMYRVFLEMQHRQRQQQQSYPTQQQQPRLMSQAMNNYYNIHSLNKTSNNYSNNSVLYNMAEQQRQNQQYNRMQQQRQHSISGPYSSNYPPPAAPRRASAPSSSYTTTNSNSCALNKANLKLNGDLMDMIVNWSMPEWQSGRRLVHFWRRTTLGADGNLSLVDCGFEPMDQQLYYQQRMRDNVAAVAAAAAAAAAASASSNSPSSTSSTLSRNGTSSNRPANTTPIVISCIYWRERNDYFITSVDCIYLLESLIGIQFTVEEKNRIRRNLEGFRPLTVSKCKAECADFFKLIMSFPHPKPRNIEKDVKVFSWKTLPHALKKIIRKYTPSYITSTPLEPIQQQQQHQQNARPMPNSVPTTMPYTPISSSVTVHHNHTSHNRF